VLYIEAENANRTKSKILVKIKIKVHKDLLGRKVEVFEYDNKH